MIGLFFLNILIIGLIFGFIIFMLRLWNSEDIK